MFYLLFHRLYNGSICGIKWVHYVLLHSFAHIHGARFFIYFIQATEYIKYGAEKIRKKS